MVLSIAVITDVVCPWCLIGTERLEQALAKYDDLEVEVVYIPYLLDPKIPPEGVDLREHLAKKYRANPDTMFARVEAAALETGIPLDFKKVRRYPNTVKAHTLVRHAHARGTHGALSKALFQAYFLEGRDVGSDDVLVDLAKQHGFKEADARAILADDAELEQTRKDARGAAEQGIGGVPFIVFANEYAISGAQPVELFQQAIDKARGAG